MASPSRATRIGSADPLSIVDVEVATAQGFLAGDPHEVHLMLNRHPDEVERRVFSLEFGQYRHLRLEIDSIRVDAQLRAIDPASIRTFLDDFNARVAHHREEAATARERLREQGRQLFEALRAEGSSR